eukprot:scaffold14582_cov96-Skeletonema_marinoi.AAC.3
MEGCRKSDDSRCRTGSKKAATYHTNVGGEISSLAFAVDRVGSPIGEERCDHIPLLKLSVSSICLKCAIAVGSYGDYQWGSSTS